MLLRISLTCVLLSLASALPAQDPFGDGNDPFGGTSGTEPFGGNTSEATDPFGGDTALGSGSTDFGTFGQNQPMVPGPADAGAVDDEDEDPDPVVRLLRASPPQTPSQMADGLTWMTRLRRWDEVGRLLDRLEKANWDLQQKAVLARAAGSSIWVKLRGEDVELTEEQRRLVTEVLSAPAKLAKTPQWMDHWIDRLSSASAGERRLAQLRLQDASMAAVERLTTRLLDGDPGVDPVMLAGTVAEFGRDGVDALRAACLVEDPQRAARMFLALAELPSQKFTAELGAGLGSRVLQPEVKAELADILTSKYGKLPSQESIHAYLTSQYQRQLAHYQKTRTDVSGLADWVWRLTPDRRSIQLVEAASSGRELERLAQLAALRLQLDNATPDDAIDGAAVLLQRAYQVSPQLPGHEIQSHLLVDLPVESGEEAAAYWQQVFERAGELQMHGAALRSLQMLAESTTEASAPLDFLSDLLRDPRPMIRYSALEALAKIDPPSSYRGAETAIETALEMSHLTGGPHALVIGLRSELRQAAQEQLQMQANARVTTTNSARGALLVLDGEEPIELIFVVDRLADQSVYELLQRLRNTKKGHSLPIAVLTDELYPHERRLILETPGIVASVLSRDPEQMKRVVDQQLATLDTEPMAPADRSNFAAVGGSFLARIAGDRQRYAFYPVGSWREHLVSAVGGLTAMSQTELLSGLGSAESQRKLVQLASGGGVEAERLAAAKAFGNSVQRFGMRLSRQDVNSSYELYNRLGPVDPVAVKSIGFVLDVIEAQAGKIPWPEGP